MNVVNRRLSGYSKDGLGVFAQKQFKTYKFL